jgi:hypothetical protein
VIIALSGYKGSGKTTAAEYLSDRYGYTEYAMAKPMKDALRVMFGMSEDQLYGPLKNEVDSRYGITPRIMLQTLGTEWAQYTLVEHSATFKRVIGRHLWAHVFLNRVWVPGHNYVISDIRFQHEIEALRDIDTVRSVMIHGGVEGDPHESENRDILTDASIINSGTLQDFCWSLDNFMESVNAF